jgi:hypothetical protein
LVRYIPPITLWHRYTRVRCLKTFIPYTWLIDRSDMEF